MTARVLTDAVRVHRIVPQHNGWFYLGDAGYGLTLWCLTPFRGVRYHLKEWEAAIAANILPKNAKELYNMRHSSLRNVIERIYGVVKARFPILRDMPHGYTIETQSNIVLSAFLIHNFIRMHQEEVDDFDNFEAEEENGGEPDLNNIEELPIEENNNEAQVWRQSIADMMWADWQIAHPPP